MMVVVKEADFKVLNTISIKYFCSCDPERSNVSFCVWKSTPGEKLVKSNFTLLRDYCSHILTTQHFEGKKHIELKRHRYDACLLPLRQCEK
jgi:hypothetical protein